MWFKSSFTIPALVVISICYIEGTVPARADILHVPSEFSTIQAGINVAQDGDEVVVADGTYTGPGNRNVLFAGKAITLRSENGPTNCIIDCESLGRGFIFYELATPATVVDGFTITNGLGHPGGAIYAYYFSSPTIKNCIITGNAGDAGGGGGFYCAMCFSTISNTIITGNTANGNGGGIYSEGGDLTIINSLISENTASLNGGGVYSDWGSTTIINSIFAGNSAANLAGGGYFAGKSNPSIINSVFWGNGPESIYSGLYNGLEVSYSNIQDAWPGDGNINQNPMFVNPAIGNYYLSFGSPCIDAGNNAAVPIGTVTDLAGNSRFVDDPNTIDTGLGKPPLVDIGALEFQVIVQCPWDLDSNQSVGISDLLILFAAWGPVPTPDPPDFDGDGIVNTVDLLILFANWGPCP